MKDETKKEYESFQVEYWEEKLKHTSKLNYLSNTTSEFKGTDNYYYLTREPLDETRITRVSGFIPLKERIKNFQIAGENLEEYRKLAYAYADDDECLSNLGMSLEEKMRSLEISSDKIEDEIEIIGKRLEAEYAKAEKAKAARAEKFRLWEEEQAKMKNPEESSREEKAAAGGPDEKPS